MITLEKRQIKKEVRFIDYRALTDNQVKDLTEKGFIVCYKNQDEWGDSVYSVYITHYSK